VVIGDARQSLAQTDALYDMIVLDAFSSDAIPLHLSPFDVSASAAPTTDPRSSGTTARTSRANELLIGGGSVSHDGPGNGSPRC